MNTLVDLTKDCINASVFYIVDKEDIIPKSINLPTLQTITWQDIPNILTIHFEVQLLIVDIFLATENWHSQVRKYFLNNILYFGNSNPMPDEKTYYINVAEGNGPAPLSTCPRILEGIKYWIRDKNTEEKIHSFEKRKELKNILCVFGATDIAGYSHRIYDIVKIIFSDSHFDIIIPDETKRETLASNNKYENIRFLSPINKLQNIFFDYDLLITSPGNIYFEALAIGVPVIAFCQNRKQESDFIGFKSVFKQNQFDKLIPEFVGNLQKPGTNITCDIPGSAAKEIVALINKLSHDEKR